MEHLVPTDYPTDLEENYLNTSLSRRENLEMSTRYRATKEIEVKSYMRKLRDGILW